MVQGDETATRFHSDDLFEGCKAKRPKIGPMLQEVMEDHSLNVSSMACGTGEILLREYMLAGVTETCCPEANPQCAGCAMWNANTQSCVACAGGFVPRVQGSNSEKSCVACLDSAGWLGSDGRNCQQLSPGDCSEQKFHGLSSNDACCKCGGGVVSPTPFLYETTEFVVGETVSMLPKPRTASRYGVDEDCALTEFNLTIDGATGEVAYAPGLDMPKETFSVTCKVTAYQAAHVVFTTSVTVSVKDLTYGAMPVVFTTATTFPLRKTAGHWSNLALSCAPKSSWLQLDAGTGSLTASAEAFASGAVDNVQDVYEGQMGGVCELSGNWTADPTAPSHKKISKMLVVKPKPLASLEYSATSISTAVGEKIPAVELKQGAEETLMPNLYQMACDDPRFVFDSLLGVGMFDGHPIVQVASNGQIVLDVPKSFESIFDAMLGNSVAEAWKLHFSCKIFGIFADDSLPVISAGLTITIRDTTCWAEDTVKGLSGPLVPVAGPSPADEAACRKLCRVRSSCAYYTWEQGNCSQVVKRTDGDWLQATAKIWNCSNTDTCREVRTQTWYHNGIYCPVGTDTLRNSVIYYKASPGTLAEDQLVLYHHRDAVDGAVASCADGSWVVKTATSADYKKPQSGYFEMHGEVLACPDKAEVRFATLPCGQPQNITEEEVKVQKIILDDPATPMAADYWLHPCECAPSSWGADTPVDPVTFEMTGDAETATYVPPPLLLVAGEFVCPTRNLLPNPGVYFETETESMEYEVCEAKCKNHDDCNYFWHGTQSSATTCRLYSACDSLVREMGLEGELLALPRAPGCVVASPTECWTVSMRRKALTDVAAESFRYWNLHAQCDMMLLMGGTGINACGRPTYRPHDYGEWNHKKQLPKSFDHGLTLKVSCWNERYSAVRGSAGSTGEVLTCVNGNWFNSADEPGMGSFDCLECVQVGSHGFNKIEQRREQELYYFNRMQLSIHSEVNQLGSDKIHCMEPKEQMDPVPIADPQGASWMVEATTLYERKPIEIMRVEMYEVHHEKKTFDGWKKWAEDQGGRLLTFEEAWTWCREGNTVFFADRGIDMWAPTLEFDGTKNWIQIGNVPWAAPGKSHDETWGWPAWADDVSQQGWGGHERGVLWMKKTTVIGASKELEMMKYKILAKQATGKDPRMTFDEAKAWVEGQGGRLMTTHEARLWIALNPKLFADKGIDMWVPVEEPDGTKDYIQAGNVPWAAPEKSHNEQWGWPGWAMDTSLQGWHPDERLLLYMKKELVTKSVWPGDTIALRNSVSRRFLRAHSDAKLIDQSEESEIPMPNGWSWERFTVVDTGYGTVALHNSVHNALLRMTPERTMDQQRHNTFDAIPERHTWERYEIVEAGNGVIALWSVIYRRFVCMRTDRVVDASPLVGSVLSNWWSGERMQVQYLDYARSKGLISWFKSETAAPDWRSSVGDYAGVAIAGEAKLYEAQGSGAVKPVKYVFGSAGDSRTARTAYDFGPVLKMEFSICSVARYLGAEHKGRIFQGNMLNLLHGHHGGHAGVVYYNGWQTDHSRNLGSTNWVVACASNTQAHVFIDGVNVGNGHVSKAGGDQSLVINAGVYPNEFSDWAVMELMTWNYGLSFEEMKNASDYLQQKVSTTSEVDGCIYEVLNIPEVDRTYSSVGAWLADTSMLDNTVGGFCPANTHFHGSESLDEWMQFDLKVVKPVGGVVIQGKYAHNGVQDWVWTFKVQYKLDVGSDWNTIDNLFTGVSLPDEKSRVFFTSPVKARFIRLTHFKFHHYACMRSAVIICNSVAANEMNLVESSTCPSTLRVEQWPDTDPESRHVVLAGGAGAGHAERCLAFGIHEGKEIIIHKPCQSDDAAQLIPARTINLMYSNLHTSNKVSTMQRGLKAEFFYGLKPSHASCLLPDVSMRQPDYVRLDAQLDYAHQGHWEGITESDYLSARWTGFLTIKHAGLYKFYISVDDSVEFFLDGNLVIQETACGVHSDLQGSVNLQAGEIPFTLQMYEYEGHMMLHLHYEGPDSGDQKVLVPTSAFTHVANANTALMTDASHTRGCVGNTGLAGMKGSIFVPSGQDTGVACGFVPVVKSDSPIVLPTSRNKNGHWPEWWAELQDMDIECSEGKVLMSIDTEWVDNKMRVAYTCGVVAGLGFCTPSWTDQRDAHQWNANDQQILGKLQIACPAGNLLNKVKFEYSIGGRWARFKTSCCKTGGPPVAAIRMGPDSSRYDAMEGEYCPVSRLPNGRLEYHQRALGAWQPLPSIHALSFDRVSGIWCISSQCSVPVAVDPNDAGYADPVGITLGALDVGPVSDFDGNFEAKGVGGAAGQNGNKYLNGKLPKNPPKRPKPPKKPKLLEFKPEMPTYSDKCVEYGDLWKNIHETVINDVGEEEATVNKLETEEEEGAGYQDAHPCDVAGDAGGTSGKIGGGDGSDTRDQMPYDQLDGCHARDIERALVDGKETFWHDTFETSTDLADNIAGMICTVIPIAAIEPFGAGVSIAAQDTCSGIKDLVTASITTSAAFRQHKFYYDMAKEDYADCNPLQTNFARLFCDIHCVRDAVIRGDRSIIRNLKQATDVTNKNLDQLSSWIVKSAYVDAGWLADKIDYAAAVNARDFESLKALLATEDEPTTLVGIRQATEQMKQELLGLAQAASFRPESAVTARDALQRFADEAPELQGSPNASQAFEALQALTSLKARLHGAAQGRSKMDQLGRQLAGGIAGVQSLARLNAKALGVYKHFQNASKHVHAGHGRLRRAEHEVLTNLDKIWWSLRGKMDTYFDAADEEVQSFQKALAKMQDYQQCHSGYPELLSTYKATMRVSGRTHRLLKNTWRQCSNLVGELASTLADSDAFNTFLEKEGCTSSLAMQTRNQARLAISGMRLLWHRFSVAGLPAPDTEILSEAVQRLEESYSDAVATQGCKKANTPAQ